MIAEPATHTRSTVLVVDDERLIRLMLKQRCEQEGYHTLEAATAREALGLLAESPDVILLDCRLPDARDLELLDRVRAAAPEVPVILMTAYSSIESSVQAMKTGAFHYVSKPFDADDMMLTISMALETTKLRREVAALRAGQSMEYALGRMVGDSPVMSTVRQLLGKIAQGPASTVLITGESGTGKDLAAKTIHYNSVRAPKPFVNITCSALPETLLESELFGHERGAFTDAKQQRKGLLEQANGGTVFLDEIGEMTAGLQAKVLRFLEDKTIRRVGGALDLRLDVRFVAATNRNLEQAVKDRTFREDLYYRLNVMPVRMPPLRERTGDVVLLAKCFVDRFNREFNKHVAGLDPSAIALLEAHSWPGNVRELKNAVERAMLLSEGHWLTSSDFQLVPQVLVDGEFQLPKNGVNLQELERSLVIQALERTGGNQTRAGQLLGLRRDQVRYRMEKFGLKPRAGDGGESTDLATDGTPEWTGERRKEPQ
ncbi:sigma-54 dependent transcriptional regulator [Myxococcota bacterium]|nr:sigma-54 dependent transcriptional regulator [Myxococcota bacterium]